MSGLRSELLIAAVVVAVDQASKAVVRASFALHESVTMIPGFFDLTRVHNFGAAFGFLNTADFPFKDLVLAAIAAVALAGLATYGATLPADQRLARVGLALIIGGAAGNLIDRIAAGYVLDLEDGSSVVVYAVDAEPSAMALIIGGAAGNALEHLRTIMEGTS